VGEEEACLREEAAVPVVQRQRGSNETIISVMTAQRERKRCCTSAGGASGVFVSLVGSVAGGFAAAAGVVPAV
jgi:hypothetical protein